MEQYKRLEKHKEYGKLYQDQLYGTKILYPLAIAIIDTPEFQRLSGLSQLGFAHVVYRCAQHTRFTHSIGTYLLSRMIMRRIVQNHERLGLQHPGEELPECFCIIPFNAYPEEIMAKKEITLSNQSKWRGLTEVVSAAALLHDISHIPFGHTLEDEYSGLYERHDKVGSSRLYELLFNKQSGLKIVFGDAYPQWIIGWGSKGGIANEELARLIYVILSWNEDIDKQLDFNLILSNELEKLKKSSEKNPEAYERLENLKNWYNDFKERKMFQPFMSDIVGNTICADLLDYLPRDRMNLGMEYRKHERLHRYLTIREGTFHKNEGKRVSILVTRPGRGGQRRDVATAVLDIMRERYEMAERVYYHHKKAAVSAMLAKLVELCGDNKPKDDENIYPSPWNMDDEKIINPQNITHFSDITLIDYLGNAKVEDKYKKLQKNLYIGIRYDRRLVYRTLLVVDVDLVTKSSRVIDYLTKNLREDEAGNPSYKNRHDIESRLAKAADAEYGDIILYCPSSDMQSKEVDARLEIFENRILPLRVQRESFAYHLDIELLERYYQELWRIYIFVSPALYKNAYACKIIVDNFCEFYGLDKTTAYLKVRKHDFRLDSNIITARSLKPVEEFLSSEEGGGLPFDDMPTRITSALISKLSQDEQYRKNIECGSDSSSRIASLFDMVILEEEAKKISKNDPLQKLIKVRIEELRSGKLSSRLIVERTAVKNKSYSDYVKELLESLLHSRNKL
jgi:hypothetical protein